jgi:hypothetical protein
MLLVSYTNGDEANVSFSSPGLESSHARAHGTNPQYANMKTQRKLQHWFQSGALALILAGSGSAGLAQVTNWIQGFDTSSTTNPWVSWWGLNPHFAWSSLDASNNAASGALQYTLNFVGAGGEQFMTFAGFHYGWQWDNTEVLDGTKYTNLVFDIKVDPSSAPSIYNDYGPMEVGFVKPSWDSGNLILVSTYMVPVSATNWTHVVLPMNPTQPGITTLAAVYFKMWSNGRFTNTLSFYLDNIEVQALPTNAPPPPPPTMTLEPTVPGLQLISTTGGGQYGRFSIHTAAATEAWINSPTSTVYSINIKQYPNSANYPNFQTHLFLVPTGSLPYGPGDASCDWNSTNAIFVQIQNNANGSGTATFMWKTNVIDHSTWGVNQVFNRTNPPNPVLHSSRITGTWTVGFQNNTNVTMTAPDGSQTNFVFSPDAIPWFTDAGGLYAFIGAQPNTTVNMGQSSVLGPISITGAVDGSGTPAADISDPFDTPPLNTSLWGIAAADPNGIQVVGADTPFWLLWTVPDTGFTLQFSEDVIGSVGWNDPGLTGILQLGPVKRVLVPAALSHTNSLFFRMDNPSYP